MVANRITTSENTSPQFLFLYLEIMPCHSFCLLITMLEFTFCHFLANNCGEIFSNVFFLLVTMRDYFVPDIFFQTVGP